MPTPSIGRIIHVMLEGSKLRPAIITRVGPNRVDDPDDKQVAYELFLAPEDVEPSPMAYHGKKQRVGHERDPEKYWEPGDWIWPARTP